MAGMVMLDLSCVHCEDMDWKPHLQNIPPHISASQCDEVSRIHFLENQEEAGVNFGDSPLWITSVQPLRPKVEEDLGFVSAKQGRERGVHGCHILTHVPGSDISGGGIFGKWNHLPPYLQVGALGGPDSDELLCPTRSFPLCQENLSLKIHCIFNILKWL